MEQLVGVGDHQVRLEHHVDVLAARGDDVRAEGEVRNEVAVHHVPLDAIDAGLLEGLALLAQAGEVCWQDRWNDLDGSGHVG